MKKYKYIFVILVYKNTRDLEECLHSIASKIISYKSIVVNAFFDLETCKQAKGIATRYDCDFINIENKGYSYGNNRGIEYANNNYDYDYLIVSNPDILIEQFDDTVIDGICNADIIAPRITTASGRMQNPMHIIKPRIADHIEYLGFKNNLPLLVYIGILISKIVRIIGISLLNLRRRRMCSIYAAHGSFVILAKNAVNKLCPVYDESMFLFAEEGVLASKANKAGLRTIYVDDIRIKHKEDGSMSLSNLSLNNELKKANIYCYENYIK